MGIVSPFSISAERVRLRHTRSGFKDRVYPRPEVGSTQRTGVGLFPFRDQADELLRNVEDQRNGDREDYQREEAGIGKLISNEAKQGCLRARRKSDCAHFRLWFFLVIDLSGKL